MVFGRALYGEVKPQEKSTRRRWLTTNCKTNRTVANCCHIRALSACPKGLRRSPRDDARISKWQWFLIFSGFSWVFFTEPETIPSAPPIYLSNRASILAKRILVSVVLALGLIYGGDYLYVRIRMLHPKPTEPFESIKSLRVLAIPGKNGKTEYEVDARNPEQVVTCVHALFPHDGYSPCWYVKPRLDRPIPM